ncbi:MAG: phosphoadenylyl-sulfate reductase [Gammaproteobacteria bacterium]|nr:phosphoadenylyl-sulfate reductase [Gammaproteobacteria bacterium]
MALQEKISQSVALLEKIAAEFSPAVLANSFGAEDMVLTDLIGRNKIGVGIITLDTGRLHDETYALMDEVREKYGNIVVPFFPRFEAVEEYVRSEGANGFYRSVESRKRCCAIRKIEPLKRALAGNKAWITGLRRAQAPTRTDLTDREWDEGNNMEKFNPLIEWTEEDVWAYLRANDVPYNKLHDQNFPSIGCSPCTRAIAKGEDVRAGRWWWEDPTLKECGLHVKQAS